MSSFKRLNTQKYLKAARIQTEDTLYWKKLSVSIKNVFQIKFRNKFDEVTLKRYDNKYVRSKLRFQHW